MKTAEIVLATRANPFGEPHTVYLTNVPGLVVHRMTDIRDRWAVTHQPSGMLILGHWYTRTNAVAFARRIAGITDWTQDQLALTAAWHGDLRAQLIAARDEFKSLRQ